MSTSIALIQPSHPVSLDDEIMAYTLQLEEARYREETSKGKHNADRVPDLEMAYTNYLEEIERHCAFLKDAKLAHSIAHAVDTDAATIAEIAQAETQAHVDRRMAVRMSNANPELEAPPPYSEDTRNDFIEDEVLRRIVSMLIDDGGDDDPDSQAGPSVPYVQRQAAALDKLSTDIFDCTACGERFRWVDITQLPCKHPYCDTCLNHVIMLAVKEKDLTLLPPRCCGTAIPYASIVKTLNEEEMEELQNAQVEKETENKTYCSGADCGRFIAPAYIQAGEATCPRCQFKTCCMCKNLAHQDACPDDPNFQATLSLANAQQWQRCYSCRALVEIDLGCNHMRCRCGSEFCYLCGAKWRQCSCAFWMEGNLTRRAEEVVDRGHNGPNLRPAERIRRVQQVQEQLRETDECQHWGKRKFEKITGGRRTLLRCEMCNVTHRKFILRCRRCHLDVCMECRLHRV